MLPAYLCDRIFGWREFLLCDRNLSLGARACFQTTIAIKCRRSRSAAV
ncbi:MULTISPECIES: hypothetical protein [Kamptonema]|nr:MULTISPECIES: hypothetical protein [Kamptonema]